MDTRTVPLPFSASAPSSSSGPLLVTFSSLLNECLRLSSSSPFCSIRLRDSELYASDFHLFCPPNCLNDACIAFAFEQFLQEQREAEGKGRRPFHNRGTCSPTVPLVASVSPTTPLVGDSAYCLVVHPCTVAWMSVEEDQEALVEALQSLGVHRRRALCLPLNDAVCFDSPYAGTHWALLVCYSPSDNLSVTGEQLRVATHTAAFGADSKPVETPSSFSHLAAAAAEIGCSDSQLTLRTSANSTASQPENINDDQNNTEQPQRRRSCLASSLVGLEPTAHVPSACCRYLYVDSSSANACYSQAKGLALKLSRLFCACVSSESTSAFGRSSDKEGAILGRQLRPPVCGAIEEKMETIERIHGSPREHLVTVDVHRTCSKQTNSYDCGVYVVCFAEVTWRWAQNCTCSGGSSSSSSSSTATAAITSTAPTSTACIVGQSRRSPKTPTVEERTEGEAVAEKDRRQQTSAALVDEKEDDSKNRAHQRGGSEKEASSAFRCCEGFCGQCREDQLLRELSLVSVQRATERRRQILQSIVDFLSSHRKKEPAEQEACL